MGECATSMFCAPIRSVAHMPGGSSFHEDWSTGRLSVTWACRRCSRSERIGLGVKRVPSDYGRSQTAGRLLEFGPYVCETTTPLA